MGIKKKKKEEKKEEEQEIKEERERSRSLSPHHNELLAEDQVPADADGEGSVANSEEERINDRARAS